MGSCGKTGLTGFATMIRGRLVKNCSVSGDMRRMRMCLCCKNCWTVSHGMRSTSLRAESGRAIAENDVLSKKLDFSSCHFSENQLQYAGTLKENPPVFNLQKACPWLQDMRLDTGASRLPSTQGNFLDQYRNIRNPTLPDAPVTERARMLHRGGTSKQGGTAKKFSFAPAYQGRSFFLPATKGEKQHETQEPRIQAL